MEDEIKYKYIEMNRLEKEDKNKKTDVYSVKNIKSQFVIGLIKWYPSWRQYCFFPSNDTLYSLGCLDNIVDFLRKLKREREK